MSRWRALLSRPKAVKAVRLPPGPTPRLPEIAEPLMRTLPTLQVAWSEDTTNALLAQLTEGRLDAALVADDALVGPWHHAILGDDPFVLAAAPQHPLVRRSDRLFGHAEAEVKAAIAARLQRTAALALQRHDGDLEILNDGHLEDAGRQLLQRLVPRMP